MKKWLFAALLVAAPAYAQVQDKPTDSVTKEAPGDSEKAEGPGSEHHPGAAHEEEADPTQHFNFFGTPWEHYGKDEYDGKFGDGVMKDPKTGVVVHEEEPMSPPFVWMLVNFGILLLLLGKFGAPAARKIAQERSDMIKSALDDAAKLREQAAKKLAEYEARIKDVDVEVKKLVDDIRAAAESDKQRILAAAQAQAAQMKRDAELRIAAEIETARAELTREVTAAAAHATEKMLREKMTPDDQRKLVSTFISNVEAR